MIATRLWYLANRRAQGGSVEDSLECFGQGQERLVGSGRPNELQANGQPLTTPVQWQREGRLPRQAERGEQRSHGSFACPRHFAAVQPSRLGLPFRLTEKEVWHFITDGADRMSRIPTAPYESFRARRGRVAPAWYPQLRTVGYVESS
jgi:hypothetical protein